MKKTLFVARRVKDGDALIKFAEDQGLVDIIKEDELHVTIAFSKDEVEWDDFAPDLEEITIDIEDAKLEKLGEAIVIKFESQELQDAWQGYIDGGASWDYESYQPHISLTYNGDQDIDSLDSFTGSITLGAEKMEEVDTNYIKNMRIAKTNSDHKTITFVILTPETVDRNGDKISQDEIIKTAHEFVINIKDKYVNVDHEDGTNLDGVIFVESFVTPIDLEMDAGTVTAGSWMVGFKFTDDDLYQDVIDGKYVGVSMEGYGWEV